MLNFGLISYTQHIIFCMKNSGFFKTLKRHFLSMHYMDTMLFLDSKALVL